MACSAAAWAQAVGDTITNPVTGGSETVVSVLENGGLLTDSENVIFLNPPAVNSTFEDNGVIYTVTGLVTGPHGVTQIQLSSGDPPVASTLDTVTNVSTELNTVPPDAEGNPGDNGGQITFTPPSGNAFIFSDRRVGAQGAGGRNGYGVRICFGIFGCITIGRSGSDGSPGGNGPTVNHVLSTTNWGHISSVSNGLPGITVSSAGGNGGSGGDSYGALPGNQGGAAGLGGVVILNSSVNVSTSGALSYGIFACSPSEPTGQIDLIA